MSGSVLERKRSTCMWTGSNTVIADDADPAVGPGLFGRLVAGVAGGLAGGVVFGVLMQMTGAIPMVAALVDQESMAVGWAVHLSIAVFVGVTFALLFGVVAVTLSMSTALGVFYGLMWWVLGGLTLLPLRLGLGLWVFDTAAWQSLAGHIAYGLTLGFGYLLAAQLLTRQPDAAPLPVEPLPPPPPPLPAPMPSPAPAPAPVAPPMSANAFPRSRLTPLPPTARAIRQRHRQ
jgi:hypothetical protein